MHSIWVDIDMPPEMLLHVVVIGVWVVDGEADVFIEVESAATGKVEMRVAVQVGQVAINEVHGPAGGKAEDGFRIAPDICRDDACDQGCGRLLIWLNNDFHSS